MLGTAVGAAAGECARIVPKIDEPLLGGVKVEVAALAGGVRESDIVGMSERNVVALGNAAVFCGCGKAKPDNVALHRIQSVGFCVDADFCGCIEFLFHLYEGFFVVDADVSGRNVCREACFYDFAVARVAGCIIGGAIALGTCRGVVGIVVAHESCFARNVFEQSNEAVDFVLFENAFERVAVDAAEFKGIEVAVVSALCL